METGYNRKIDYEQADERYFEAMEYLENLAIMKGIDKMKDFNCLYPNEKGKMALDSLISDYRSMLLFLRNGGIDHNHERMQKEIAIRATNLMDQMHREMRLKDMNDDYSRAYKRTEQWQQKINFFFHTKTHERTENSIYNMLMNSISDMEYKNDDTDDWSVIDSEEGPFYAIWTLPKLNQEDAQELQHTLEDLPPHTVRFLLSALLMAVWEYFDPEKLNIIIHFTYSPNTEIHTSALLAYVLIVLRYEKRIELYSEVFELSPLAYIKKGISSIQHFLYLEKYSTLIYQKLTQRVKELEAGMKSLEELQECTKTALTYRVDMNPSTFCTLYKKNYFQQLHHWWMPFSKRQKTVEKAIKETKENNLSQLISMLQLNCCDVDLYAVVQLLQNGNSTIKMAMFGQENNQMEIEDGDIHDKEKTAWEYYSHLTQNLFRFITYSKWNKKCSTCPKLNPFTNVTDMLQNKILQKYLSTKGKKKLMDMLMWAGIYNEAEFIGNHIMENAECDTELLIQMGMCKYLQNNFSKALIDLKKAEALQPMNEWIILKIANCYIKIKYFLEAINYLEKCKSIPNIPLENYLPQLAYCQTKTEMFDKAVLSYTKMKENQITPAEASRGLFVCFFHMKQYNKAKYYFQEFMHSHQDEANSKDLAIGGHIALLLHNWEEASKYYHKSMHAFMQEQETNNLEDWKCLSDDAKLLEQHGISHEDLCLMEDIIKYEEN